MGNEALGALERTSPRLPAQQHLGSLILDALRVSRLAWGAEIPVCPTVFEICLAPGDYMRINDREILERALGRLAAIRAQSMCMVTIGDVEVRLRPLAGVRSGLPEIVAMFRQEEHAVLDQLAGTRGAEAVVVTLDGKEFCPGTPERAGSLSGVLPLRQLHEFSAGTATRRRGLRIPL